jgi:TetR/AcrR family transcriptional regulator, transcriptional repressor of bet genes
MPGKKVSEGVRREQILQAALEVALRERLSGLTIRSVAAEAGVSTGLVFFHFESKEGLLLELLRWLLQTTIVAEVGPEIAQLPRPSERMLALLHQELHQVVRKRERLELLFDYWVLGGHEPAIRELIGAAFDGYRTSYMPFMEALLQERPRRFAGTTPEGLALVVVSLIQGYALLVIKEPDRADAETVLRTVAVLVEQP